MKTNSEKYIFKNNLNETAKCWQRNYYEHIIRNERSLNNIRKYIYYNPVQWDLDIENKNIYYNTNEHQRNNYYKQIY